MTGANIPALMDTSIIIIVKLVRAEYVSAFDHFSYAYWLLVLEDMVNVLYESEHMITHCVFGLQWDKPEEFALFEQELQTQTKLHNPPHRLQSVSLVPSTSQVCHKQQVQILTHPFR